MMCKGHLFCRHTTKGKSLQDLPFFSVPELFYCTERCIFRYPLLLLVEGLIPYYTMKALDQSLYILSDIQQHPDRTSNFDFSKGGHGVKKLIYRISAAIVVAGIIIMKRRTQRT